MLVRVRPLTGAEWRERLSIRKYEWIGYSLAALTGGAWGGLAIGLLFQCCSQKGTVGGPPTRFAAKRAQLARSGVRAVRGGPHWRGPASGTVPQAVAKSASGCGDGRGR